MKNHLLSSAAITALMLGASVPAHAAPPAYNWTGFYLGLNAGGAWGRSKTTTTSDCSLPLGTGYYCTAGGADAANGAAVDAAGTGTINTNRFTGGLQAGYNWQVANYVYGVETDYGAFRLKGSRSQSGTYPVTNGQVSAGDQFTVGSSFKTDWLFTLRGRLGWTVMPNLLAYGTGGLAVTRLAVDNSFSDFSTQAGSPAGESGHSSKTKAGWTVGGGLEWGLNEHWSVKGEYLYIDFGKVTATGIITNPGSGVAYSQGLSTKIDVTAQVARLGVNYKF